MIPQITATKADLADLLGLSPRRLRQLETEGVLPKPTRQGFDLKRAVKGYIGFLKKGRGALTEERIMLTRAKRRQEELSLRQREGELLEKDAVQQDAFQTGRRVRDQLLAIPDRVSGVVSAESDQFKNHQTLLEEIVRVCEELSEWCGADPHPKKKGNSHARKPARARR